MLVRALVVAVVSMTAIIDPEVPAGSRGTPVLKKASAAADFPFTVMTDSNYQAMLGATGVHVVFAISRWSGQVRQMAPAMASLPFEPAQFTLWHVDVDDAPGATAALKIRNIPSIIILRDGKEVKRSSGSMPKSMLEAFIRSALP